VYAECLKLAHYAECQYAKCRYAECRGARKKVLEYTPNDLVIGYRRRIIKVIETIFVDKTFKDDS
jgi:hypothetical protein